MRARCVAGARSLIKRCTCGFVVRFCYYIGCADGITCRLQRSHLRLHAMADSWGATSGLRLPMCQWCVAWGACVALPDAPNFTNGAVAPFSLLHACTLPLPVPARSSHLRRETSPVAAAARSTVTQTDLSRGWCLHVHRALHRPRDARSLRPQVATPRASRAVGGAAAVLQCCGADPV